MIKLFVMDVDRTLTDGSIFIGEHGEIMKRICEFVSQSDGGRGAVREFIEWIRDCGK